MEDICFAILCWSPSYIHMNHRRCTCVPSLLNLLPFPFPSHLSRWTQSTGFELPASYSGLPRLSLLHMVVCVCLNAPLSVHPSLSFPHCVHRSVLSSASSLLPYRSVHLSTLPVYALILSSIKPWGSLGFGILKIWTQGKILWGSLKSETSVLNAPWAKKGPANPLILSTSCISPSTRPMTRASLCPTERGCLCLMACSCFSPRHPSDQCQCLRGQRASPGTLEPEPCPWASLPQPTGHQQQRAGLQKGSQPGVSRSAYRLLVGIWRSLPRLDVKLWCSVKWKIISRETHWVNTCGQASCSELETEPAPPNPRHCPSSTSSSALGFWWRSLFFLILLELFIHYTQNTLLFSCSVVSDSLWPHGL